MAKRIAKFEKVSFAQFEAAWKDTFDESSTEKIQKIYDGIELPKRATSGSAGYDFYAPVDFTIAPGETVKIPTGIRVHMEEEWVLKCYPRSGLGFKYRLQLNNTVGIIDSDIIILTMKDIICQETHDSNEGKTVELRKPVMDSCRGIFVAASDG